MNIRNLFGPNPHERKVIGEEARQLLENKHLRAALDAMEDYMVSQAKSCDPDNKDKTQRVVIGMQILEGFKREFIRKIEDGEVAKIEIAEIEARNRPRLFRR